MTPLEVERQSTVSDDLRHSKGKYWTEKCYFSLKRTPCSSRTGIGLEKRKSKSDQHSSNAPTTLVCMNSLMSFLIFCLAAYFNPDDSRSGIFCIPAFVLDCGLNAYFSTYAIAPLPCFFHNHIVAISFGQIKVVRHSLRTFTKSSSPNKSIVPLINCRLT